MEDLIKAAEALITYIEENDIHDSTADNGDGYIDTWKSDEFSSTIHNLQQAIEEVAPIRDAMKLIKKCFIKSV